MPTHTEKTLCKGYVQQLLPQAGPQEDGLDLPPYRQTQLRQGKMPLLLFNRLPQIEETRLAILFKEEL